VEGAAVIAIVMGATILPIITFFENSEKKGLHFELTASM
jgi:hypothetical protein